MAVFGIFLMSLAVMSGYLEGRWPDRPTSSKQVVALLDIKSQNPRLARFIRNFIGAMLDRAPGVRMRPIEEVQYFRADADIYAESVAARRLGISKIIGGVLVDPGPKVVLYTVNVDNALVEDAVLVTVDVERPVREIIRPLVIDGVLLSLDITLPEAEATKLTHAAFDGLSDEDKQYAEASVKEYEEYYRLLDDAFGGPSAANTTTPPSRPSVQSRAWSILPWIAPAYAQQMNDSDSAAIRILLDRYRLALESHNVVDLENLYVKLTDEQRSKIKQYFERAENLRVEISDYSILVSRTGKDALVTFTRRDTFVDSRLQRKFQLDVRMSSQIQKVDEEWKIVGFSAAS
ncbi:MAG TPA: hypothetical protein VKA21_07190 [Candidatus Binatia bacterium]|nr:hypothetical protein [Candidatus Binatia bacterium]